MAGKTLQRKLDELGRLRSQPEVPGTLAALREALADRSNVIAAKAAALVARWERRELLPDLLDAYARFFEDPVKTDPQCTGKAALAQALKDLGCEDPEPFLRGIRHFQHEPGYGGSRDTAAGLRATCGLALLACRRLPDLTVLRHLTDLLCDPEASVRADAARGIGSMGRAEGALLLRLKIRCGDERAPVTGSCLAALLAVEGAEAVPLVASFLASNDEDLPWEAAAALGESRDPAAFEALRRAFERAQEPRFRRALLVSIGTSLQPAAIAYLIARITPADLRTASEAIEALAPARFRDEVRQQVESAVARTGNDLLIRALRKHFPD